MSLPDFDRAQYVEPGIVEGNSGLVAGSQRARQAAFPLALAYGVVAAVVGAIAYGLVGLTGFMVSIVAIGVGWLVAKAMMTASGGVGGREYQIAAVGLTYLACGMGPVFDVLWSLHERGVPVAANLGSLIPLLLKMAVAGPLLALRNPLNGALGLLILFFGLRTAWQMAAGSPGFQNRGAGSAGPFGRGGLFGR